MTLAIRFMTYKKSYIYALKIRTNSGRRYSTKKEGASVGTTIF
jgi:hypothetical protein